VAPGDRRQPHRGRPAEFDCAPEDEAELVEGIGDGLFQGGFDALKRRFAASVGRVRPTVVLGGAGSSPTAFGTGARRKPSPS
jgi:hypothetical protein